jgi:hypothetical protein
MSSRPHTFDELGGVSTGMRGEMLNLMRAFEETVKTSGNAGAKSMLSELRTKRSSHHNQPPPASPQPPAPSLAMLPSSHHAFSVAAFVDVKRCTRPGFNRPGGHARVRTQNADGTYNVTYIVAGGGERNIEEDQLAAVQPYLIARRGESAMVGLSPQSAKTLREEHSMQQRQIVALKAEANASRYAVQHARSAMHEHQRAASSANAAAAAAQAARMRSEEGAIHLEAQLYTALRTGSDMVVDAAAAAVEATAEVAAGQMRARNAESRRRELELTKLRDAAEARRMRAEHDAALLAQGCARAEIAVEREAEGRRLAEERVRKMTVAEAVVKAEHARQRKAAATRASKKTNAARTGRRAAVNLKRLTGEVEKQRALMIQTRKSAAPKAHHTMRGILAQLAVRDAGRLGSGRVGPVIKAFDAFRTDGQSFNLQPAGRTVIDRFLWKRYLADLCLQNDEIEALLATLKAGILSSGDMSAMLGSELFVSALCLVGSFLLEETDTDGEPMMNTFANKYENPVLAVEGKTGEDLAGVMTVI